MTKTKYSGFARIITNEKTHLIHSFETKAHACSLSLNLLTLRKD